MEEEFQEFSRAALTPEEREQVRELIWERSYQIKRRKARAAGLKVWGAFLSAAAALAGVASLVRDLLSTKPH